MIEKGEKGEWDTSIMSHTSKLNNENAFSTIHVVFIDFQ